MTDELQVRIAADLGQTIRSLEAVENRLKRIEAASASATKAAKDHQASLSQTVGKGLQTANGGLGGAGGRLGGMVAGAGGLFAGGAGGFAALAAGAMAVGAVFSRLEAEINRQVEVSRRRTDLEFRLIDALKQARESRQREREGLLGGLSTQPRETLLAAGGPEMVADAERLAQAAGVPQGQAQAALAGLLSRMRPDQVRTAMPALSRLTTAGVPLDQAAGFIGENPLVGSNPATTDAVVRRGFRQFLGNPLIGDAEIDARMESSRAGIAADPVARRAREIARARAEAEGLTALLLRRPEVTDADRAEAAASTDRAQAAARARAAAARTAELYGPLGSGAFGGMTAETAERVRAETMARLGAGGGDARFQELLAGEMASARSQSPEQLAAARSQREIEDQARPIIGALRRAGLNQEADRLQGTFSSDASLERTTGARVTGDAFQELQRQTAVLQKIADSMTGFAAIADRLKDITSTEGSAQTRATRAQIDAAAALAGTPSTP